MKRTAIFLSLLFSLLLLGEEAIAKSDSSKLSVVRYDTLSAVIKSYIEESSSKYFQDPVVPRFLIKDRKDSFIFGIGGYVAAHGYYDNNALIGPYFVVSSIPMGNARLNPNYFDLSMAQTRISFKVIGVTKSGVINAYIETDFMGDNYAMRLRHAYLEFMGIKVGKTWSTYMDDTNINTIDPQGPMSLSTRLLPLVSYSIKQAEKYKFTVALEFPQDVTITFPGGLTPSGDVEVHQALQSYPDIPVSLIYDNGPYHLFLGYNQRVMKFSELGKKFSPHYTFSAQLSGSYAFETNGVMEHKIFLQGIHTYGMADCIQDLGNIGYNAVISADLSRIELIHNSAFYAGYHLGFLGKNQINLLYSHLKQWNLDSLGYDNLYDSGHYVCFNYMREFLEYGIFGVEGLYGMKRDISGNRGDNFRISLYLRYDF
ncbi:MAG: hypothetical protein IKC17_05805 [Bacteroidales bacterium]|nr:hypothetical protein [Bacteroidales bacterium]